MTLEELDRLATFAVVYPPDYSCPIRTSIVLDLIDLARQALTLTKPLALPGPAAVGEKSATVLPTQGAGPFAPSAGALTDEEASRMARDLVAPLDGFQYDLSRKTISERLLTIAGEQYERGRREAAERCIQIADAQIYAESSDAPCTAIICAIRAEFGLEKEEVGQ